MEALAPAVEALAQALAQAEEASAQAEVECGHGQLQLVEHGRLSTLRTWAPDFGRLRTSVPLLLELRR